MQEQPNIEPQLPLVEQSYSVKLTHEPTLWIGKKSKGSYRHADNKIVNQTFSPNSPARVALASLPPFSFLRYMDHSYNTAGSWVLSY